MIKKIIYVLMSLIVSVMIVFSVIDLIKITQKEEADFVLKVLEPIVVIDETIVEINDSQTQEDKVIIIEAPLKEDIMIEPEDVFIISELSESLIKDMMGKSIRENMVIELNDLRLLSITYYNFEAEKAVGDLIVHEKVADEVMAIFKELFHAKYPINNIDLVDVYNGDDDKSMAANNTHAFNYRTISGRKILSNHAYGLAIDINPMNNPYIKGDFVTPPGALKFVDRSIYQMGMIIKYDMCYNAFSNRGWQWGGDWTSLKDYQHFEKKIEGINQ